MKDSERYRRSEKLNLPLFKKLTWWFALFAAIGTILLAYYGYRLYATEDTKLNNPQTVDTITNQDTQLEAKLWSLIYCESSGSSTIKILDTNGYFSYGLLQFQLRTAHEQGIKYELLPPDIELEEVKNIILEPDFQLELGRKMLADKKYRHWKVCSTKLKF